MNRLHCYAPIMATLTLALLVNCGGSQGSSGSQPNPNPNPNPSVSEGIALGRGMLGDVRTTAKSTVSANFWQPQGDKFHETLKGMAPNSARLGHYLQWMHQAVRALDASGEAERQTQFPVYGSWGWAWEYVDHQSRIKAYPAKLVRTATGLTYTLDGGMENPAMTWTGSIVVTARWTDGSIKDFRMEHASFPGESKWSMGTAENDWSYTVVPTSKDVLNLTVSTGDEGARAAKGMVQSYANGAQEASVTTEILSAAWSEQEQGGIGQNTHMAIPSALSLKQTAGTFTLEGAFAFTDVKRNPTVASPVKDAPVVGWQGLDGQGSTPTRMTFKGTCSNHQGGEVAVDFSLACTNYEGLRFDQAVSDTNTPSMDMRLDTRLQMPTQPLLTIGIGGKISNRFSVGTTLEYSFGTRKLNGQGTYFPPVPGQTSGLHYTADLVNEKDVKIHLEENRQGRISGTVTWKGLTIATLEQNNGLGTRVKFVDGTFESLW